MDIFHFCLLTCFCHWLHMTTSNKRTWWWWPTHSLPRLAPPCFWFWYVDWWMPPSWWRCDRSQPAGSAAEADWCCSPVGRRLDTRAAGDAQQGAQESSVPSSRAAADTADWSRPTRCSLLTCHCESGWCLPAGGGDMLWSPIVRWTWVSRCQNVSVLDFVGARVMEVVSGDNWSYKTCKALVKSSLPTNWHPTFYRPDAHSVDQPIVSEHWKQKYHIPWTCSPQANMGGLRTLLQVRISAWATLHQGLLSLTSIRGRQMSTSCGWEGKGRYGSFCLRMKCRVCR